MKFACLNRHHSEAGKAIEANLEQGIGDIVDHAMTKN
jgi:hypothetical protein